MKKFALAASIASILCLAVSVDAGLAGGSQALNVSSIALVEPVATGSAPMSYQEQNMTIGRYCFRCHNDQLLTGGLSLESFYAEHAYENPEIAEKMDLPSSGLSNEGLKASINDFIDRMIV